MRPPEVFKEGNQLCLHSSLSELMQLCWKEGRVPQDMRDAKIVTLFKNKGDRSDCNNYRVMSLLSIVGKVFARVVLTDYIYWLNVCIQSHSAALDLLLTWSFL